MKNIFGNIFYVVFSLIIMFLLFIIEYEYQISKVTIFGVGLVFLAIIYGSAKYAKKNKRIYYVLIYSNKIVIKDVLEETETEASIEKNATSSTMLVIKNYSEVEQTLKNGFNKYFKQKWFKPRPLIFIHAVGTKEYELSEIETKAFSELAFSIGASKVFVTTGFELNTEELIKNSRRK